MRWRQSWASHSKLLAPYAMSVACVLYLRSCTARMSMRCSTSRAITWYSPDFSLEGLGLGLRSRV
eukprot:2111239-Rhodomonas_salina.1